MFKKDRHLLALNKIMVDVGPESNACLIVDLDTTFDGRIHPSDFLPGVVSCKYSRKSNSATISLSIGMNEIIMSDDAFGKWLSSALRLGADTMLAYLESRKVTVDRYDFNTQVETILERYQALKYPLPPHPAEARIHSWDSVNKRLMKGDLSSLGTVSRASFFAYFDSVVDARRFAASVGSEDVRCSIRRQSDNKIRCVLSVTTDSWQTVKELDHLLRKRASWAGGTYDGWEGTP